MHSFTRAFCNSKQLDINLSKTQIIIFKSLSKKLPNDLELVLDSLTFPVLSHMKLLGVTLHRHLTYKDHISATVNTCNGYLGVLRRIASSFPRELCFLFYSFIIRAHLEFASGLLIPGPWPKHIWISLTSSKGKLQESSVKHPRIAMLNLY